MTQPLPPIPVTVLTGFLGAGKTTLLNRLLREQHGRRVAVIENEFGEIGIDHQLVLTADEEIVEMNNGCVCCTVRGDLIRILGRLARRQPRLDAVIIETTGLADPGPVAQTFFTAPEVLAHYRLDGIVTVVDAKHAALHLDADDEAAAQVAFADVILLNKTDLVATEELAQLEQRLHRLNAAARIHRTVQSAGPLADLLQIGGFNLNRATELDPQFLEPEYPFEWGGAFVLPAGDTTVALAAGPDESLDLAFVPWPADDAAAAERAAEFAVRCFAETPEAAPPGAGRHRLALGSEGASCRLSVTRAGTYGVFTQHHPTEFSARFIGPDGAPLIPTWSRAYKPDHAHDDAVGSVGLTWDGDLEPRRVNRWLEELLATRGTDIFRSKGVLALRGVAERVVFQGVHMLFAAAPDRPWKVGEPRRNTLVFIGRNLDRAALTRDFLACRA